MSQWPGYDKVVYLTAADDFDFDGTFPRVPANQRLVKIILTIKTTPSDADGAALFQRSITTTADSDGNVILADGASTVTGIAYRNIGAVKTGSALFHILIPRSVTVTLPVGPDLPYDVQCTSSAGRDATIDKGVFRVRNQITISR